MTGLREGSDGVTRCFWAGDLPDYQHYHDHEWGRPMVDDRRLFEKICLEGFQSGQSWLTILRKRDNFRKAFDDFQPEKIARWTQKRIDKAMKNPGIIRSPIKIAATIRNAQVSAEASTICVKRYGNDGLKITSIQLLTW